MRDSETRAMEEIGGAGLKDSGGCDAIAAPEVAEPASQVFGTSRALAL